MPRFINVKNSLLTLALMALVSLAHGTAQADPISVCTGVGCSTTNVSGTIVAGNGTVTITLNNDLAQANVVSVIQNVSGVYFQVSGYTLGAVSLSGSSATNSTNVSVANVATPAGAVNPTGWGAGHDGAVISVCVVCAGSFGVGPTAGPEQTIIGGTGSGLYPGANGSIAGNNPHNPFLTGTVTFTLVVPGVTANSTFSNVVIQFGTAATPPGTQTEVPEPASMFLLGTGLVGAAAAYRRRRQKQ
jgi:hypothetical protein